MTLLESLTLMLALVFICAQLYRMGHKLGAVATCLALIFAVLISWYWPLILALGFASILLLTIQFAKPQWLGRQVRINSLRFWVQHLLALSLFLIAAQYVIYHFLLANYGSVAWLQRPNVLDAFLPIAGGIELRAFVQYGYVDKQHPAAAIMLVLVLLTAIFCKRSFCGWACPLGLIGEYLYKARTKFIPKTYAPPSWLDWLLRTIKYWLLAALIYLVIAMPAPMLPQYLQGYYHKIADLKMAYFFASPTFVSLTVFIGILLIASWRRQGFCRYICPYGALLGIVSVLSPLKIRRQSSACLRDAKAMACDKCSRACPANIKVHQLVTVRTDECQACMRCVAACPKKAALSFSLKTGHSLSHVGVVILLFSVLFGLAFVAYLLGYWESETPENVRKFLMLNIDKIGI